ncbi:SUMF1/EgtB/PvdO family nonheme iron enzyme [Prosthecobacter sp.]|uniref:bifunctional serine/threonine-protein kinase/formylglycine-generating enzyme family protein n=1 Tax=Prosthecobacter sp. TaxID=1965333 RepID=UPI002ABCBD95|nr:SUMF1/EgtB/PvdO family nonheme iron enzyme [Prosthecobacter sp.]MDZ4401935.1 SUMF1/EgtB/PvdO family nonheme iron enzyme [Prosthecobacter sp.]
MSHDSNPPATRSSASWQPPTAQELAAMLPQYEIEMLLGRGGMGAVYKGRQISLDRPVAIKILSNTLDEADTSFAERFKNEARAMAKLTHPGIVAVYDFGQTASGLLYIVMEFVEGTDVSRMIAQQKRLHTDHAMAITAHVCDALAYAHERGIIHRDIKPANIMVGYDGVVKVADFGLAKMTQSGESGLTQSGMAMGTLCYMAPEALMLGTGVDHRADIYAVGVMLYQMLTGKLPQGMFELPSLQVPGLDPRYDGIIAKALRDDREMRYQSVLEMRQNLDSILTQPVVKVEENAKQAPAALPTQARPQHPGGQPYRPQQPQIVVRTAKNSSPLLWAALIAIGGVAGWLFLKDSGGSGVPSPEIAPVASSSPAVASTLPQSSGTISATKEPPFLNSLGMKFLPVPITGGPTDKQRVLFSVWETRVQDYEVFMQETKLARVNVKFEQGPMHPMVAVSWDNAQAFCVWLTDREHKAGRLGTAESYRLPTDHEWSCAVGIGGQENVARRPKEKGTWKTVNGKGVIPEVFPWDGAWPPPDGAGNYRGEEIIESELNKNMTAVPGYRDGFPATAPVGSFAINRFGLYDIGGNVWEWCEDIFDIESTSRVVRGASWQEGSRIGLLSSWRRDFQPAYHLSDVGFRCVVAPTTPTPPTATSAAPTPATIVSAPAFDLQQLPDFRTRVANYQKARYAQLSDLTTKYRAALVTAKDAAVKSGVLTEAAAADAAIAHATAFVAVIEKNLSATAVVPLPALPALKDPAPPRLKELRDIFVRETAKIEITLVTSLDQSLASVHASLTTAANANAAKTVETYRQQMMAVFKTSQAVVTTTSQSSSTESPLLSATKDKPFVNTLGMKFVPVPGIKVLFCIHETRKADYAAYAASAANVDTSWKKGDDQEQQPVVRVSWEDANGFCAWLSKKEGHAYRLPTDEEWSYAVGIGEREAQETPKGSPQDKSGKIEGVYPWGGYYPPTPQDGNYVASIVNDGYSWTAPVMSFKPNALGLYDMGGNAWEWCQDHPHPSMQARVLRGGCCALDREPPLSSSRSSNRPDCHIATYGFRCVLAEGQSSIATTAQPATSTVSPPAGGSVSTVQPVNSTSSAKADPAVSRLAAAAKAFPLTSMPESAKDRARRGVSIVKVIATDIKVALQLSKEQEAWIKKRDEKLQTDCGLVRIREAANGGGSNQVVELHGEALRDVLEQFSMEQLLTWEAILGPDAQQMRSYTGGPYLDAIKKKRLAGIPPGG